MLFRLAHSRIQTARSDVSSVPYEMLCINTAAIQTDIQDFSSKRNRVQSQLSFFHLRPATQLAQVLSWLLPEVLASEMIIVFLKPSSELWVLNQHWASITRAVFSCAFSRMPLRHMNFNNTLSMWQIPGSLRVRFSGDHGTRSVTVWGRAKPSHVIESFSWDCTLKLSCGIIEQNT